MRTTDSKGNHDRNQTSIILYKFRSAPGPDGYTSKFFKVFWETTQIQLVDMVRSFFGSLNIHPLMNHTNITLIPKVDSPKIITLQTYQFMSRHIQNHIKNPSQPYKTSLSFLNQSVSMCIRASKVHS